MPYKGHKKGLKVRKFDRQPGLPNKITKNSAQNNPKKTALLTNLKVKIFKTDGIMTIECPVTVFIVPWGTDKGKFC